MTCTGNRYFTCSRWTLLKSPDDRIVVRPASRYQRPKTRVVDKQTLHGPYRPSSIRASSKDFPGQDDLVFGVTLSVCTSYPVSSEHVWFTTYYQRESPSKPLMAFEAFLHIRHTSIVTIASMCVSFYFL